MPTYQFRHRETQEVIEKFMKMAEREPWLAANPDYEQVILETPKINDPIWDGHAQPPSDFQKYIVGKVAEMPGSNLKNNTKYKVPKEW